MARPTTPQPLRLAFIGGYGHHYLAKALDDDTLDVEAIAVASDRHDAAATAGKFKNQLDDRGTWRARWYDDPSALFTEFKPTALSIGGVYAHDGPLIAEALSHDIPTVADKPIAATWDDLAAIERAVESYTYTDADAGIGERANAQRTILTEFDFRSRPAFRAAAKAVEDGRLGPLALASAQKSYRFANRPEFYKRREDYGSTMLWIASHGIDAIRFVTGQRFESVHARHGNVTRPDYGQMEDHAVAMFSLEGGTSAVVHADLLRPVAAPTHGDDRLRIVGQYAQVEIKDGRCTLITDDDPPSDITDTVNPLPIHRELLSALAGEPNPWYSTAQSLEIARVLLHARDAADTGHPRAL